jgi:hypothetical protein
MLFLHGLILVTLILIAWQDFKERAIYWWLFLILFITVAQAKVIQYNWQFMLNNLLDNSSFLSIQILCLSLYFSLKEQRWVNIFSRYFGLGDLLFLVGIMPYFTFINYIAFYLLSLLAVMLTCLFFTKGFKAKIPLAGLQAIVFGLYSIAGLLNKNITLIPAGFLNYLGR